MAISSFQVGDVTIGGGALFLIAGPCVIESEAHALKMAEAIAAVAREKKLPYIFKASYDKANRTSIRSFRGPGIEEGLRILRKVRETVKVPVLTDVHEAADVPRVAEAVDVLQIPAFLCRQTDLLVAAGKSGRAVNIKKGQFVSPWDMRHAVEKVREAGGERVFLTERGAVVRLQQPGGGHALAGHHARVCAGGLRRDPFGAASVSGGADRRAERRWCGSGCRAAASPSSFRCCRARRLPPAWTASSWKCMTIRRRRSPTAPTRST